MSFKKSNHIDAIIKIIKTNQNSLISVCDVEDTIQQDESNKKKLIM